MKLAPGDDGDLADILVLSTEDGRLIFYSTANTANSEREGKTAELSIPNCLPVGQLGGNSAGLSGRIKDFEVLDLQSLGSSCGMSLVVSGSSDGSIRLWTVAQKVFTSRLSSVDTLPKEDTDKSPEAKSNGSATKDDSLPFALEVGRLIGTYETGNRITCLKAFVMSGAPEESFTEAEVSGDHGSDGESSDESGSN